MKNGIFLSFFILIMSYVIFYHGMIFSADYGYVGVAVCKECHGQEAMGNQYKIWLASPHSKAFLTLKTEKAKNIAENVGVTSPIEDVRCLKCHATGGGKNKSILSEGVGCEACHGPGEEYHKANIHVDYSSRENGYNRAIKHGMNPILGINALKRREKLCLSCHTDKRPCYEYDLKNPYRYRLPIQTIDSLMKDGVNFSHPLRK
ncbi:MAG TPA: cytochrome c family protein [Spirochaetota bacterium]|nr:cytochrome c family protein [Spirochaetota bacterium]